MGKEFIITVTCDGCGDDITEARSSGYQSDFCLELSSERRKGRSSVSDNDPMPQSLYFCNFTCLTTWDMRGQMTYAEFLERGYVDSRREMARHDHPSIPGNPTT